MKISLSETLRPQRVMTTLAASLTLTVLAGCGSSNGNKTVTLSATPTPTPVTTPTPITSPTPTNTVTGGAGNSASQTQTASAEASLNALIAGNVDPSPSAIANVRSQFATAYATDKTNAQASFGLGVTDIALFAQQVINDVTAATKSKHLSRAQTTTFNSISAVAQQAIAWKTKSLTGSTNTSVATAAVQLPLTLSRQQLPITTAEYDVLITDITNLNTAIATDLPYIAEAAGYSSLEFPVNGLNSTGTTTYIDQGDAIAVQAAFDVAHAATSIVLSYNLNYGTFAYATPLSTAFASATDGQTLTPDQYLPASPFGTLNSNGKALFASAQTDLSAAATLIRSDITIVRNRTTTGHLIPNLSISSTDYLVADGAVAEFQAALTGPYTVDGTTYNLNAWFTNPPASLRALEPNWHVRVYTDGNGSKVYGFTNTSADYPDTTFGGLIAGGTPIALGGNALSYTLASGQAGINSPSGENFEANDLENDPIVVLAEGGSASFDSFYYNTFFPTGG